MGRVLTVWLTLAVLIAPMIGPALHAAPSDAGGDHCHHHHDDVPHESDHDADDCAVCHFVAHAAAAHVTSTAIFIAPLPRDRVFTHRPAAVSAETSSPHPARAPPLGIARSC